MEGKAFLEMFSGVGGLTRAVARLGLKIEAPRDAANAAYTKKTGFDLTKKSDVQAVAKLIKQGKISWIHFAPPCSTFSRARHGTGPQPLRSEDRPEGLAAPKARPWCVLEANLLVKHTIKLAKLAAKAGAFVSIENPEHSLMWAMPAMQAFMNQPGML